MTSLGKNHPDPRRVAVQSPSLKLLDLLINRVLHAKCRAGWSTRFLGEIPITSDMQITPPLWQKAKRNSWWKRSLLMKGEKAGLKQHSKHQDHGIQSHHFMANRWRKKWKQWQTSFSWAPKSLWMVTAAMKLKDSCSLKEKLWQACCCCWVTSVVSDSVRPHRWQPTRLSRPWDSPGKNTGVSKLHVKKHTIL